MRLWHSQKLLARTPDMRATSSKAPCDICRGVYWDINLDGSILPCPHCGHVGGQRLPPDYNHGEGYELRKAKS